MNILPDVKGDGNHSVQNDDVGPEGKEAGKGSINPILSWKKRGKVLLLLLPDAISNS